MLAFVLGMDTSSAGEPLEDFDTVWKDGRWTFSNGPEFPGAKGRFGRSAGAARKGKFGGELHFDFRTGGNYVSTGIMTDKAPDIAAIELWLRSPQGNSVVMRYTDQTWQTLQKKLTGPYDNWTYERIDCVNFTVHWGGANDGKIHGPPRRLAFLVENDRSVQGSILFDEIRLVPGKPQLPTQKWTAFNFATDEIWHTWGENGANSKYSKGVWNVNFANGGTGVLSAIDTCLPGTPKKIRIRFKGDAAGRKLRLRMTTHFMHFDRDLGEAKPVAGKPGEFEFVTHAPPGDGWRWFGGEDDGKLHGPLRIRQLFLDANGKKGVANLKLQNIAIETECPNNRVLNLSAAYRNDKGFVVNITTIGTQPIEAKLNWDIFDWDGAKILTGSRAITIKPEARALEITVPKPTADRNFYEAVFHVDAGGFQIVPPARACWAAPVPKKAGAARLEPNSPFGMGLYLYRYSNHEAGLREMRHAAAMAAAAGIKWSREEFNWGRIERVKGKPDWSFYDKVVATAKANGVSVYGLIGYWSGWTKPYTKEGIDDYCAFVSKVVTHYKKDIKHWEIWNEPNIFFWQGPREMYAELLTRAYKAVKDADPEAEVLGCSTAGIDQEFIKLTMKLGGRFDALTVHPYRGRLDDRRFIKELRDTATLARLPNGKLPKIWITEMGWATHTPHATLNSGFLATSERRQASLIVRTYVDTIQSGVVANTCWYNFRNDGIDPYNFEFNLGVITRDFRPKPAYRTYATMTTLLKGMTPKEDLKLGPDIIATRFASKSGESVICLWSVKGTRTARVPSAKPMQRINAVGESKIVHARGGVIAVPLREEVPVFLK